MSDMLSVEVLEDGTIKVTTSAVSAANHMQADAFLKFLAEAARGKQERRRRVGVGVRVHEHGGISHEH